MAARHRHGWVLALLLCACGEGPLAPGAVTGPGSLADADWSEIDARLQAAVEPDTEGGGCDSAEVCGLEFRFGRGQEPWYNSSFGEWQPDQRIRVASAGKWLVAATLMTLVDAGVLALDEPIGNYWPGLDPDHSAITLRQLLSHTSGLFPQQACTSDQTVHTLQQCAQEILASPLVAPPGTRFMYGAAGIQVAGAIAEAVTGEPWRELFEQQLAQPLGMSATAFGSTGGQYDDTTQNPQLAGGAISTASDYDRFLEMIAGFGVFRGQRILSEWAWTEMHREQTADAEYLECPLEIEDCRTIRWGTAGFAAGSPTSKYVPYGLGNYLVIVDADGRGLRMSSPGAYGVRGWVDVEYNYRALLFMDGTQQASTAIYEDVLPILEAKIGSR